MTTPSGDAARHLQKLAALIAQRRVALGFASKEAAAEACGISHTTYRKIEFGRPVRGTSYAKLEFAFGFRPGSVKAVLEGTSDSITLEDGTELIEGGQVTRVDPTVFESALKDAVRSSATLTRPDITLGEVEAMNERIVEKLRNLGILPSAP
ncbi:helix-turn-helix domain-containing protein [Streptomyces sp. NPDC017086]|uniref:helix-turn-helix domain-containing protein n=1 Tax=Streptomyces sp. NPDC017086 TaxID=3364976 RepID=UPI0037A36CB6